MPEPVRRALPRLPSSRPHRAAHILRRRVVKGLPEGVHPESAVAAWMDTGGQKDGEPILPGLDPQAGSGEAGVTKSGLGGAGTGERVLPLEQPAKAAAHGGTVDVGMGGLAQDRLFAEPCIGGEPRLGVQGQIRSGAEQSSVTSDTIQTEGIFVMNDAFQKLVAPAAVFGRRDGYFGG